MPASTPAKLSRDLLSVSFNQDGSCISVGTRKGYSIANAEPFGKVYTKADGPCSIVEMLFCTSLVAIVGTADSQPSSSPRKLKIVNTKRQSTICELVFPTAVLGVRLNRRRLIVILEEEIYIYDISNMKLLHTIETSPNPQAICALSPSSEPCYLAYPSPVPSPNSPFSNSSSSHNSPGDVLIFDLLSLSVTNIIQAHKTPISSLSLNSNGSLLATASDKGTVIRVFSVPGAQKLYQFRRGTYNARIYSIAFNAVSSLLAVSSDTETVHIFKLSPNGSASSSSKAARLSSNSTLDSPSLNSVESSENGSPTSHARGAGGYEAFIDDKKKSGGLSGSIRKRSMAFGRNISGSVGGYLPNSLAEMWEPSRDFAFLKLPSNGVSSVVAISSTTPQIMCVTSEGLFYCYNIDLESGGECTLMKQYSLLDGDEGNAAASTTLAD